MHENGLGVQSAKARTFSGSELKESQPQDPGAKPAPGAPGRVLTIRRLTINIRVNVLGWMIQG
jgi:hypothetical protein